MSRSEQRIFFLVNQSYGYKDNMLLNSFLKLVEENQEKQKM